MNILLISDTHNMKALLRETVLPKHAAEVGYAIHLGDYVRDLLYLRSKYPNITMAGVDGAYENAEGTEHILTIAGKRILLLHGHTAYVKSDLSYIAQYAKQKNVDACFFGHTHEPTIFTEHNIFFMNPGSLSQPRSNANGSYGLVSISTQGQISGEVKYV